MINKYHQQILEDINRLSKTGKADRDGFGLKYIGTDKSSFHLDTATTRKIAKDFLKAHPLSLFEFESLLESIYKGKTCDEIFIAAKLVEFSPHYRRQFNLIQLSNWLNHVHGWAEVDVLCQMAFTADDFLVRWSEWEKLLKNLCFDSNVHKRRASLVLLTKPVRMSDDSRLSDTAFWIVDHLKSDKDILITKAISWVLRSLIKNHRDEVSIYLTQNKETLPRVAVREVSTKLATGRKYLKPDVS